MKAIPAVRAARGGLSGRKVQAIVIGAVLLVSTAASTLALSMLVDSNAPFDHAFAAQHGAQVTATVTGASRPGTRRHRPPDRGDGGGRAVPGDDRHGQGADHPERPGGGARARGTGPVAGPSRSPSS